MSRRITATELNAFVIPAVEVLEKLARTSTQVGTLQHQPCTIPLERWVIVIGVEGDLNGRLVFVFDPPVLDKILTSMLGTPTASLTESICWDAMGETANIIAGKAAGRLEALGLHITITPPQILPWKDVSRGLPDNEGIIVPLQSNLGEVGISVFIEKV